MINTPGEPKQTVKSEGKTRMEAEEQGSTSSAAEHPLSRQYPSSETEEPESKTRPEANAPGKPSQRAKPKHVMSMEDEKLSVLAVISDLEKQLNVAFSIKDAQEEELASLKQELETTQIHAAELEGKVEKLETALVSQEEMESQLEFFENTRIESVKKIKALEEDLDHQSTLLAEYKQTAQLHVAEIKTKDASIEQLEDELHKSIATLQTAQDQIALLEQQREELTNKLESAERNMRKAVAESEVAKNNYKNANNSLGEIRQMLTDTRDKARQQYYKKLKKPAEA
jgi:chromosome segregation ATPase